MKSVILTGLRANNDLHLGNYLGALLPMIDMAKKHAGEYQINLFVPDLHSITTPIDYEKLQDQIKQNLRVFVAAGLPLNYAGIHLYRQSYIPAHSELTWILDCFTGMGEMARMTQYKNKTLIESKEALAAGKQLLEESQKTEDSIKAFHERFATNTEKVNREANYLMFESQTAKLGLFNYPVLMAADILLYGATYIPVGDDQSQHLEFTRDIAQRMNAKFGDLFVVPKPVKEQHDFFGKDQGLRVRDLVDPTKKMSKSDETGKGVIFLTDSPETARKKILSATTDSVGMIGHDYQTQPGVSNLLDILKLFGEDTDSFIGQKQYGALKEKVAGVVSDFLEQFQSAVKQVDDKALLAKLLTSEKAMTETANATLLKVLKAVGLRPKN